MLSRVALALFLSAGLLSAAGPGSLGRPMLDAHNCYPEDGRWADRLSRALSTSTRPIGVEQDLVWKPDTATPVVGHEADLAGNEPSLEDYFFKAVTPTMDEALKAGAKNTWPLIVLHFDFKTNEPEHHRAVLALLKKYDRWLTTSVRTADDRVQPLRLGPMLVLTEAGEGQQRDFYDTLAVGETMRIFGTVPNAKLTDSRDSDVQAEAAISAAPSMLLPAGATNYRRWANLGWSNVERGGQSKAGEWTADDRSRLSSIVARAHELGLWLRFYTLDGFSSAENRGWSGSYNFGSAEAARERWRAAIDAGVDFIATDQYEAMARLFEK
jgi:hypothetical protein